MFSAPKKLEPEKLLGATIVIAGGINLLTLGVVILTNLAFLGLRPRGNYVQLLDGRVVEVGEKEANYRSAETIRRFVRESLTMLFSWNGLKPGEDGKLVPDEGIEVGDGRKVGALAHQASFAFRDGLRQQLLRELGGMMPVNPRRTPTVFVLDFLSTPRELRPGVWEVDVVGRVLLLRERGMGETVTAFNRKLVIRAVEPVALGPELGLFEPLVRVRAAGLQVEQISALGVN